MLGISLYKRILIYLIAGIMFGLFFTLFFSGVSGFDFMFGFIQDAAITGASFGILVGLMLEIYKKITAIKFKKIRFEITQTNSVLFNSAAIRFNEGTHLLPDPEGWLFLTDESLIYKTRKPKFQNQDIIIPVNTIQSIDKIKFSAISLVTDNGPYKFIVDNVKKLYDLLNKTPEVI